MAMISSCSDDTIAPLGTHDGGDHDEDQPIIIAPPEDSTTTVNTYNFSN